MEYKKAAAVLMGLLEKHSLNEEEKEAVLTALGVLDWAAIGKNRLNGKIKAQRAKREKSTEW